MVSKILGVTLIFTILCAVLAASPLNKQFTMGFGKRSYFIDPEDASEVIMLSSDNPLLEGNYAKRYDMSKFQMGFGKRSFDKRLNQFHMGLGKRSFHMGLGKRYIEEPEVYLKRSFHMGLGKR